MTPLESLATKFPEYTCTPFLGGLDILPNSPGDWRVSIFDINGTFYVSCFWGYAEDGSRFPSPRVIKFENLDAAKLEQAVNYVLALRKSF